MIANSTFGKFCQSPLNYTYADLCLSSDDFKNHISSPRFLKATIINKDVAIVEYKPAKVHFMSAFPIACTILDLSKLYMYY